MESSCQNIEKDKLLDIEKRQGIVKIFMNICIKILKNIDIEILMNIDPDESQKRKTDI